MHLKFMTIHIYGIWSHIVISKTNWTNQPIYYLKHLTPFRMRLNIYVPSDIELEGLQLLASVIKFYKGYKTLELWRRLSGKDAHWKHVRIRVWIPRTNIYSKCVRQSACNLMLRKARVETSESQNKLAS